MMWEIEVEAENELTACYAARDAFACDTSRGQITVCQYLDGEYSGFTEPHLVGNPFVGPHPGVPERDPTSFNP